MGPQRHVFIVGLGNPGVRYARTRHNVGFECVNRLAEVYGWAFTRRQAKALLASGEREGLKITLIKPMTYMNLSGQAVASLARFYKITYQDILVIYDDLDLPVGRIRLRPGGGSAGHKGMESIIEALGSEDFPRLRVGIGRPTGGDAVEYVLQPFSADEAIIIARVYDRVVAAVSVFLRAGIEAAMNEFNGSRGDVEQSVAS